MQPDLFSTLQQHLRAAVSQRPARAVLLWGKPGIGKTHLVKSLLSSATCAHLFLCTKQLSPQMVRLLPNGDKLPTWIKQSLESISRDPLVSLAGILDVFVAALDELTPFVLTIDGLHEANPEQLKWISQLAKAVKGVRGLTLLVTARSTLEHFQDYQLEPLDSTAATALLNQQVNAVLPSEGVTWICERAEGNPLFLLEYWRYLLRQGCFWSDGQHWHWRPPEAGFMPTSLEALIIQMVNTLPQDYRLIIKTRALLETTLHTNISKDLWAHAVGVNNEQLLKAIPHLQSIGLLQHETIAHSLFADVMVQHLDPPIKQDIARHALQYLENAPPQEALAFLELAELPREQTLAKFEAAMREALEAKDDIAWAYLVNRAIGFAPETLQANWALRAANIFMSIDNAQAMPLAERAHHLKPEDIAATVTLARCYQYAGKNQNSIEALFRQLPKEVQNHPEMLAHQLRVLRDQDKFVEAVQFWRKHPKCNFDYATLNVVLFCMVHSPEYLQEVEALAQQCLSLPLTRPERAVIHLHRAGAYIHLAQSREAFECFNEAVTEANCDEGRRVLMMIRGTRAFLYEKLGFYKEMFEDLEANAQAHLENGDRHRYANAIANLAKPLTDQGNFERAETLLLCAQKDMSYYPFDEWHINIERNLSYLYSHWHTPSSLSLSIHYAQRAIAMTTNYPRPEILVEMLSQGAKVFAKANDWSKAQELCHEAINLAKTAKGAELALLEARAILVEHFEGVAAALELYQQCHDLAIQEEQELNKHLASLEIARLQQDKKRAQQERAWFAERNLQTYVALCDKYFPADSVISPPRVNISLCLKVLGKVMLEKKGARVRYSGSRRLEILCYLLEARIAGQNQVTFQDLAEVFYTDLSDKEAKHILKQTIYLIRKSLGQEVIISTSNGYMLGDSVTSDAELFLQSPTDAKTQLWRGEYLEHFSSGWNPQVRESLVVALRRNLKQTVDPNEIQRLGNILLIMEPYDLEALEITLKTTQKISLKQAVILYQTAKKRFNEVGEALPKNMQEFLGT